MPATTTDRPASCSPAGAVARWATPRTPGRPTFGGAIAKVAEALGKPLQPWQRQVVDVATELVPDPSGRIVIAGVRHTWAYTTVVVHVQRQAGKTTLLGPKNLHRCLVVDGAKTWLTAQTRQDGRDTWRDVAELVARSPLAGVVTVRRSNGSEELAVPATGASFRVFAPTEDALHGKANESVDVDEGWAFDGPQGLALQQAILPTFTTTGGQLWLTSTAGTGASSWLRGYVERGRAAVDAGANRGLAYFEWSLAPADAAVVTETLAELQRAGYTLDDRLDQLLDQAVDLVLAAHPGQYVRRQAVRDAALTMPAGEFLRAYGNVWTLTSDRVIPDHSWTGCRDQQLPPPEAGDLTLAFAVPLDSRQVAIAGSWRVGTAPAVDVLDVVPMAQAADRIEQLAGRYRVRVVGYDKSGPALDLADELGRRGVVELQGTSTREYATACSQLLQLVVDQLLRHRGTSALDRAVANAAKRELGDLWLWSRRTSAGSIAELEAATVALYVHDHRPAPAPAPVVYTRNTPPAPAASRPAAPRTLLL